MEFLGQLAQINNPNGLSFYKGTACPIIIDKYVPFEERAMGVLRKFLEDGETLQTTGAIIKEQLDAMEQGLVDIENKYKNTKRSVKKRLEEWAKDMGPSEEYLVAMWYMNVYILLKLKIIENDEMNGMWYMNVK
tara:strand:- start:42 stop:443 length:402 start_codon:yes stop_codon:yes gene_type:complete